MSVEDFQLINGTLIGNLIIGRDFSETYHQQGVNLNEYGKTNDYSFGENNNYYRKGNANLQLELNLQKDGGHFKEDITHRNLMVKHVCACFLDEATMATTGGSETEINN